MLPESTTGVALDPLARAREHVRTQSKLLFGSSDRLEVAVAIAKSPDGMVNATDLSWDLRIANNRVRAQLLALTNLGFLSQHPADNGKRWYERKPSPFWDMCVHVHQAWSR